MDDAAFVDVDGRGRVDEVADADGDDVVGLGVVDCEEELAGAVGVGEELDA